MILEMKVPSPGESITEVEIAEWLVSDGDYVEKDQAIAEVDSDKATLELPAEESGIITLKAEEGDAVAVGEVVCLIDTSAEKPKDGAVKTEEKKVDKTEVTVEHEEPARKEVVKESYAKGVPSPAARKILDEKGIDPASLNGTGKEGRITKEDAVQSVPSMGSPTGGSRGEHRTKLSMLRRKVAERLVAAKNETAMLTTFNEVDMSAVFELRKQYKEIFKDKHDVSLGFMSFFTKAVIRALKMFPSVISMIDGKEMLTFDFCDISIAVSGPGGTFTISNGGVFGSMLSTPIINPPQSGILGMHNIVERPVVKEGTIVIAPIMYVALSYDHRIIDGKESVGFLVAVKEALENPVELLMEGSPEKSLEL
jgi:2-oxoglutarate dehydrogenase E2 component (dihydrolipoamide succinyltransferase)